jgi:Sulfotransferase family
MALPNFFIVGAAKCGTTSLAHYLSLHPQVHMSALKEPRYFAFEPSSSLAFCGPGDAEGYADTITDLARYTELFQQGAGKFARGEASVAYMYEPGAAQRIRAMVPEAKLIVILREPAKRAFSNYLHLRRDGREDQKNFRKALDLEERRIADNYGFIWRYKSLGKYGEQLDRLFDVFPAQQIRIYRHSDLALHLGVVLGDICRFLGLSDMPPQQGVLRLNESGIPRSRWLYDLLQGESRLRRLGALAVPRGLKQAIRARILEQPQLDEGTAAYLSDFYASDQERLHALLSGDIARESVFAVATKQLS